MLEWESFRYPEGGTYLGPVDFAFNGPNRQFLPQPGLGFAQRGNPVEPDQSGESGFVTRWSPQWLDGTLGLYYRNFADKLPQTFLTQVAPNNSRYNLIYADDIDLWGISFAKNVYGVSVGAEFSYRQNTPLNSQRAGRIPRAAERRRNQRPRGNTLHGLVNGLGLIPRTPVFDTATYAAELVWAKWTSVNSGANLFGGGLCALQSARVATNRMAARRRTTGASAGVHADAGSRCFPASICRLRSRTRAA